MAAIAMAVTAAASVYAATRKQPKPPPVVRNLEAEQQISNKMPPVNYAQIYDEITGSQMSFIKGNDGRVSLSYRGNRVPLETNSEFPLVRQVRGQEIPREAAAVIALSQAMQSLRSTIERMESTSPELIPANHEFITSFKTAQNQAIERGFDSRQNAVDAKLAKMGLSNSSTALGMQIALAKERAEAQAKANLEYYGLAQNLKQQTIDNMFRRGDNLAENANIELNRFGTETRNMLEQRAQDMDADLRTQEMEQRRAMAIAQEKQANADRAKQFGQGMVAAIGGTADMINRNVAAPITEIAGYGVQHVGEAVKNAGFENVGSSIRSFGDQTREVAKGYANSNAGQDLPQSEFLKTEIAPDTAGTVLKGAGYGVGEIPSYAFGGAGIKLLTKVGGVAKVPWINAINKFLETPINKNTIAGFAGAGAGAELAKSDDPNTSDVENAVREMAGGMLGGVTATAATMKATKAVADLTLQKALNPVRAIRERNFTKKYGAKNGINEEAIAAAEKLGTPLTPDIISDNPAAAFLINNKLKSQFADEAYKKTIDNIPASVIKSLEDNVLDNIGAKVHGTTSDSAAAVASEEARNWLAINTKKWQAQSTKLYDDAKAIFSSQKTQRTTEQDRIWQEADKQISKLSKQMKKTTNDAQKKLLSEQSTAILQLAKRNADALSSDYKIKPKQVIDLADKLIYELSFGAKSSTTQKAQVRNKIQEFKQEVQNGIGVRDLLGWKQDLNDIGADSDSYKSLLTAIAKEIDNEVTSYANSGQASTEFAKAWKIATDYNKKMIQNIIKTDAVNKLLSKEMPVEAVKYMNSKNAVNEMSRIIRNPELMGKLKRSAFEKQLYDKNIITPKGDLNITQFKKLITKEQDFVVSLIGSENYKTLQQDFMPYLDQLNKSKAGLVNSSGTSYVTKDLSLQEASDNMLPNSLWGALAGSFGGIKGIALGGGAGAARGVSAKRQIAEIKRLSQMATDPKLMKKLIEEGRKNPKNNMLDAITINNPGVKYSSIKGSAKVIDAHTEENKKNPKGKAINDLANNPYVKKGAEVLESNPWLDK